MCGIIGAVSNKDIVSILINGLKLLEYRGYDSAGIAIINKKKLFLSVKTKGKVNNLINKLEKIIINGVIGIAHTRWATHGKPNNKNAHPHVISNRLAIVHNGIIENYINIKKKFINKGINFNSNTDTEVIGWFIFLKITNGIDMRIALQDLLLNCKGNYSLSIIDKKNPDILWGVCQGSSLIVGKNKNGNFLASSDFALEYICNNFIYLKKGDIVSLTKDTINIKNNIGEMVYRKAKKK